MKFISVNGKLINVDNINSIIHNVPKDTSGVNYSYSVVFVMKDNAAKEDNPSWLYAPKNRAWGNDKAGYEAALEAYKWFQSNCILTFGEDTQDRKD
jgi:hypothetical protein